MCKWSGGSRKWSKILYLTREYKGIRYEREKELRIISRYLVWTTGSMTGPSTMEDQVWGQCEEMMLSSKSLKNIQAWCRVGSPTWKAEKKSKMNIQCFFYSKWSFPDSNLLLQIKMPSSYSSHSSLVRGDSMIKSGSCSHNYDDWPKGGHPTQTQALSSFGAFKLETRKTDDQWLSGLELWIAMFLPFRKNGIG